MLATLIIASQRTASLSYRVAMPRLWLQRTNDPKVSKVRMHLDLESDVEAEVRRLEALGAKRWGHQQERGH